MASLPPEERVRDYDCETEEQAANDRHLTHVGVTGANLPAAMGDDNDGDDIEKLGDDSESFRHRAVE